MENRKLEDFSTEELQELKIDKLYGLNDIIKLCKQLGNKNWENNVMVKAYRDKIIEIDNILNARGV